MGKLSNPVKAAIIGAIGVVMAALIAGAFSLIAGNKPKEVIKPEVVPPPATIKVVPNLERETTASEIETLRDISMWDLRGWKLLAKGETNPRVSPANYVNYLHVKMVKHADKYRARYSTSGSLIDLRCITQSAEILTKAITDHTDGARVEYEVDVDVSSEPVGSEFLIVIEGTYWNSFQGSGEQDVSTYTDKDMQQMDELAVFVLLPDGKPLRNARTWDRATNANKSDPFEPYRGSSKSFYQDTEGHFVYWSIGERKADRQYKITWDW